MSGRSAQAKGRRGEIELVQYLREHGYKDAKPGAAVNFGTQPDITGIDGLHIECKRHEKLELNKWYRQAVEDARRETSCNIPAEPGAMDDSIIFSGFYRNERGRNTWLKPIQKLSAMNRL